MWAGRLAGRVLPRHPPPKHGEVLGSAAVSTAVHGHAGVEFPGHSKGGVLTGTHPSITSSATALHTLKHFGESGDWGTSLLALFSDCDISDAWTAWGLSSESSSPLAHPLHRLFWSPVLTSSADLLWPRALYLYPLL